MTPIDILLVEDNEGDILLTTEALQEGKIAKSIIVVRDGLEAVNFLLKKGKYKQCSTPDLVLLDINLPKLNGYEVLKQIQAHEELRDLAVIILSTSPSDGEILRPHDTHQNYYISKPINAEDFEKVAQSIRTFYCSQVNFTKSSY